MKKAYNAQKIILGKDDLVPDPMTREPADFSEADWIDRDDVQEMDADFTA